MARTSDNLFFEVTRQEEGRRLDAALTALLPDMGLRGRRRLCEQGLALVNGKPAQPAYKVRSGQRIEIASKTEKATSSQMRTDLKTAPCGQINEEIHGRQNDDAAYDDARLLQRSAHLALLYKPSGMHTAHLAGISNCSLEKRLKELIPDVPQINLLNRLDQFTSGIVAAALDDEGTEFYHTVQSNGYLEKRYLAILEGRLRRPVLACGRILQDNRRRVRVLQESDQDFHRHTFFFPIAELDAVRCAALLSRAGCRESEVTCPRDGATLAGCVICRGARHQIRAHAAALGHPLLGDAKYGAKSLTETFFLHHARLLLDGMDMCVLPLWLKYMEGGGSNVCENAVRWLDRPPSRPFSK
ncbi:MAG: hypothetical protein J6I40_03965 [Mailhella sp.]|nr:hypothetical protein [Mailhella sp.]